MARIGVTPETTPERSRPVSLKRAGMAARAQVYYSEASYRSTNGRASRQSASLRRLAVAAVPDESTWRYAHCVTRNKPVE